MNYKELIEILCEYCDNDILISKKSLCNSLKMCSVYETSNNHEYIIFIENERCCFNAINRIYVAYKENSIRNNTIVYVDQGEDMIRILCITKYRGSVDTIGLCSREYLEPYIARSERL